MFTSEKLWVKIADTPSSQAQGLMFVKDMPYDQGMLFKFNKLQVLNFWGQNTFIPLDIAFVDDNNVIRKISHISPMSNKNVSSDCECLYAIEANYGFFEKNKISVGDIININKDDLLNFVTFGKKKRIKGKILEAQLVENDNIPELSSDDIERYLEDNNEQEDEDNIEENKIVEPDQLDELENIDEKDVNIPEPKPELEPELEIEPKPIDLDEKIEPVKIVDEKTVDNVMKDYPVFTIVTEAINWAKNNNEAMRIKYITKSGKQIIRDVEPHGDFVSKSTTNNILVTFDRNVNDIRAFIIKNILEYSFLGNKFNKKFNLV